GTQIQIIYYLANSHDNVYQRDIEKEFNIRRSTEINILKTMEKNNLIWRKSVKSDSRLKRIILSDKAKEMQDAIGKFMDENNQKILSTLGTIERHSFVR